MSEQDRPADKESAEKAGESKDGDDGSAHASALIPSVR